MPIGSLFSGAGLLAGGVRSLFSGEARERRQARREERQEARQERREERQAQRSPEAEPVIDIARGNGGPARPDKPTDFGEMVKKYWWVGLILLFVLKPDILGKPKRPYRRRAAKPKVVTRYRTRRAPAKRRR